MFARSSPNAGTGQQCDTDLLELLRCPASGDLLTSREGELCCAGAHDYRYPVVNGVPVLICDEHSIFRRRDYLTGESSDSEGTLRRIHRTVQTLLPSLSENSVAGRNYLHLAQLLTTRTQTTGRAPKLLIIGGATLGVGVEDLFGVPGIRVIETDVVCGPRTQVICDGHNLPFADGTFDAVICQAVLEHVADPARVVAEIHRVSAQDGFVYSEIPFMQQVHMGAYDFTRFTQIGHRRLFRNFDPIAVGVQGGPGMALAWSIQYFLLAFVGRSRAARAAVRVLTSCLFFWLKYLDRYLLRKPGASDAASGTFFLGKRSERVISDREIVGTYSGAD